jgi:hypothetical protein
MPWMPWTSGYEQQLESAIGPNPLFTMFGGECVQVLPNECPHLHVHPIAASNASSCDDSSTRGYQ